MKGVPNYREEGSIFSFDVFLFTGLNATRRRVELNAEEVNSTVGIGVCARVAEWEAEEMERRVPGKSGKKRRFF